MFKEDFDTLATDVGGQHFLQDGQGDARFVTQTGHLAVAGIELFDGPRLSGQGVVAAVVFADAAAQVAIGAGGAELLDPGVFVGRHGLLGELAAEPVGFLGEQYATTGAGRRERRGTTAQAAADDDDIRPHFLVFGVRVGAQVGQCGQRSQRREAEKGASVHAVEGSINRWHWVTKNGSGGRCRREILANSS